MSIVTAATVPLHPFPNKDEEDDNNVGMSLSPAPSPHTTLTPIEAARLSSQTKEVVNNNENSDQSMPVAEDGAIAALLPRSEDDKLDKILTPTGTLNMSGLVSLNSNASDDGNANDGHSAATCNKEQTKEQMLEDRVADLEQRLASLAEICDSLMKQQQEIQYRSPATPTPPSTSPSHRRFDTETEELSQWPPAKQPLLDSPEVCTRRRRRKSSAKVEQQSKPPKTMSMVLLDIAPGESRGPSMIPFTEDLDEVGGSSGGERGLDSTNSSESEGKCHPAYRTSPELEAPPTLNDDDRHDSPKNNSSETSSNESTPRRQLSRLHSSLKVAPMQDSNLECQSYTSTHLEALRLRHEAGKVRAYSFNDTLAKTPEEKYRKHREERSSSKNESKLPTISSPLQNTPLFNVLKSDATGNQQVTESADTFVQVLSPEPDTDTSKLNVPILSSESKTPNDRKPETVSVLPRKDSTASNTSTKSNKSTEYKPTSATPPSKNEGKSSKANAMSEKERKVSKRSNALTVVGNTTARSSENTPETSSDSNNKKSMKEYIINDLLNIDSRHQDGSATEDIDANMEEFLRIPFKLENLMWFSLAVCTDSFLYVWTLLPLKAIWGCVCLLCTIVSRNEGIKGIAFHRRHLYALLQCFLVWFVFYHVLRPISIGKLYHWIRGQAMLKLYVLIAIVEVFDRLLCSFGQDAWDSLYWNTTRRPKHPRLLISMIVVGVYVTIHSLFLFVHVATLSVAVNSADNALLTLLISGNFAEIKSTVFKKYNKQNLFKITTSDICERFKLALFLLLILLLNCFQGEMSKSMVKEYYMMCLIVMVAELISDWIKHSFITKFNLIKSTAYFDYALILSGDVTGIGHEGLNLDYTHAAVKRIGLAQIPLVCVTARYLHEALRFTIAFKGNGDVDHPANALSEFFDVPQWKFYFCLFVSMVALVGLKIGLGGSIRLLARHYLGGDVIEFLERKSSSKKPSTPKTPREREANSTQPEKEESKKNK